VAEREKLQRELDRLADAIATTGGSPTLMNTLQAGERRLRDVEREARSCDVPALGRDEIERALRDTLADLAGGPPPPGPTGAADAQKASGR
jgi:hypothetical protein